MAGFVLERKIITHHTHRKHSSHYFSAASNSVASWLAGWVALARLLLCIFKTSVVTTSTSSTYESNTDNGNFDAFVQLFYSTLLWVESAVVRQVLILLTQNSLSLWLVICCCYLHADKIEGHTHGTANLLAHKFLWWIWKFCTSFLRLCDYSLTDIWKIKMADSPVSYVRPCGFTFKQKCCECVASKCDLC